MRRWVPVFLTLAACSTAQGPTPAVPDEPTPAGDAQVQTHIAPEDPHVAPEHAHADPSVEDSASPASTPIDPAVISTEPTVTPTEAEPVPQPPASDPQQESGSPDPVASAPAAPDTPAPARGTGSAGGASTPAPQDTTSGVTSPTRADVAPSTDPAPVAEPVVEPVVTAPEVAQPITYTLGSNSYAGVLVRYDRSALVRGHDHVLVAKTVRGTVTWTPGDPTACAVRVDVPVASLVVDPPGSRRRAGLEGETDEKDKAAILDNALGKNQLDANNHPNMSFRSTGCEAAGDRVDVRGLLTIRGVDKAVKIRMIVDATDERFSARGSLTVTHGDFGFKPYTAVLGTLRNDDDLTFDLHFKGTP